MPPQRRYRICETSEPVLTVDAEADLNAEVVYLLVADEAIEYESGLSQIAYIGRTERDVKRIAESAASKIAHALDNGFLRLEAFVIWANRQPRERSSLPDVLERAILIRFKERFGELPILNSRGYVPGTDQDYFTIVALDRVIDRHSKSRQNRSKRNLR